MSNSYWGYWLVVFGVAIVGLMVSVNGITLTQTQDFYSLREIADVSMLEAVDYAYYRDYNEVKIDKEKFMEVFIRQIAEVMGPNETYEVNFYAIYEAPPKVSVEVKSNSGTDFISSTGYDTVSRVDAIIQIYADDGSSGGTVTPEPDPEPDPTPDPEPDPTPDPELPGDPEDPEDPVEDIACRNRIDDSLDVVGKSAWAMGEIPTYETSQISKQITDGIKSGEEVKVLGQGMSIKRYWAVERKDGSCAWVDSTFMAVDIEEYTGIETNIYNTSHSEYYTSDNPIPGLTNEKLYNNDYRPIAVYSFAQKLKDAAEIADASGVILEINDAYRPYTVSQHAKEKFLYYLDNVAPLNVNQNVGNIDCADDPEKRTCNTSSSNGFGPRYFLSFGTSAHNTACAVDITFKGATMPTNMHELSYHARLYDIQGGSLRKDYKDVETLYNIMRGAGLTILESEWWHYQDDSCHSAVRNIIDRENSFWSNV